MVNPCQFIRQQLGIRPFISRPGFGIIYQSDDGISKSESSSENLSFSRQNREYGLCVTGIKKKISETYVYICIQSFCMNVVIMKK